LKQASNSDLKFSTTMLNQSPHIRSRVAHFIRTLLQAEEADSDLLANPIAAVIAVPFDVAWNTAYYKLEHTPCKLLKTLLQRGCDPIVYSDGNLRAYMALGQREPPRDELCKLIEFESDFAGDEVIPPELRCLEKLVTRVQAACVQNGKRGARLQLKADWGQHSIYVLDDRRQSSAGGIWACRRHDHLPQYRRIPMEFEGPFELTFPWSSVRSSVLEVQTGRKFVCALLFADVVNDPTVDPTSGRPPAGDHPVDVGLALVRVKCERPMPPALRPSSPNTIVAIDIDDDEDAPAPMAKRLRTAVVSPVQKTKPAKMKPPPSTTQKPQVQQPLMMFMGRKSQVNHEDERARLEAECDKLDESIQAYRSKAAMAEEAYVPPALDA
jgi:hypothetical protein